ncbi:hypothetical protein GCM10012275_40730 [Longimycelium tulufanense]|uniref:DUF3558 domain-containing protein n=2 Tax=Longimycelium tulufanense TaxID=907463 RepID=A0A8J3FWF7_9PSEU|nr:hypothetical protein GCM10012275_40730 [Longimycelium tulufanense]
MALFASGCTWGGTAHSGRATAPAPLPTTTKPGLPERPRELPLDMVDPCSLLTPRQRAELGLDGPPKPYTDSRFSHARACSMRDNHRGVATRLALVTDQGIEVWLDGTAQVEAKPIQVAGFPALEVRTPGQDTFCNVEVDVADAQFLDILLRDGGNQHVPPLDTLCAGAREIAEEAVSTLAANTP